MRNIGMIVLGAAMSQVWLAFLHNADPRSLAGALLLTLGLPLYVVGVHRDERRSAEKKR